MISVPFAALEKLLLELGFHAVAVPGTHLLFEHPEAQLEIALRPYKPTDVVAPHSLVYVRQQLDAFGILDREEFEEQLRQRSLVG